MAITDDSSVVSLINKYTLWRLVTSNEKNEDDNDLFAFEVWLNTQTEKENLFNELKVFVDTHGEFINWHECTHDEQTPQPCVFSEEYRR